MGQKNLTWCDRCGTKTDRLTAYWQLTDSEHRTTESSAKKKCKLDLCDDCLSKTQKEFQNNRKFIDEPI